MEMGNVQLDRRHHENVKRTVMSAAAAANHSRGAKKRSVRVCRCGTEVKNESQFYLDKIMVRFQKTDR